MTPFSFCGENSPSATFKTELMALWIEQEWIPEQATDDWTIVGMSNTLLEWQVLTKFTAQTLLQDDYYFVGRVRAAQSNVPYIFQHTTLGELDESTGVYLYQFACGDKQLDVLVASSYFSDNWYQVSIACLPESFLPIWASFQKQCEKFAYPEDRVMIIGGNTRSFEPKARLENIILSDLLKADILSDVQSFFDSGVEVYKQMGLNPFRKLLFAGVPGTGKTLLCGALANWALDREYRVIYVSSASRSQGENDGANFWKIQYALEVARDAKKPTLIILEEMDAYLKEEEKALILNVLDGSEGEENLFGTLLVATTNYPEAIDERVLKRPGRLDRIYIIPPIEDKAQAIGMLQHYMRSVWHDELADFAPELIGYPGAFVREVAVYAMTQLVASGSKEISLEQLRNSYQKLRQQIDDRNKLVKLNAHGNSAGIGFSLNSKA